MSSKEEDRDCPARKLSRLESDKPAAGQVDMVESGTAGDVLQDNREWAARLEQLLYCPVCYELIRPPADMCSMAHSVCIRCRRRLSECPLCFNPFAPTKNYMISKISELIRYPCLFEPGGCKETYYLKDEEDHVRKCQSVVHHCKVGTCAWVGPKSELKKHVGEDHGCVWQKDWNFAGFMNLNMTQSKRTTYLLVIENELFWIMFDFRYGFRCLENRNKMYLCVQHLGYKQGFGYKIIYQIDERRQVEFTSKMDDDISQELLSRKTIADSSNCLEIQCQSLKCLLSNFSLRKVKYNCEIQRPGVLMERSKSLPCWSSWSKTPP